MTRTLLFAGGGTGGHLFPGLAIAERVRELDPACRCVFVCSDRPLDARILTAAGVEFSASPARPLSPSPPGLARFALGWRRARAHAAGLIARAQGQDVRVVATGGFVAGPAVRAALSARVPVLLVNLDAVPGKANRWIAARGPDVVTALPAEGYPAWEVVGPIVRRAALPSGDPPACRSRLGLDPGTRTLLVTGGSQGAGSINTMLAHLARTQPEIFFAGGPWQVIHQTGSQAAPGAPGSSEDLAEAYAGAGVRSLVRPFLEAMGDAWGAADAAVGRAGAGTVYEAWASRVPTLFLPYPWHRDEHQRRNALPLERAGGALIATDSKDGPANAQGPPGAALSDLLGDPARRTAMREALAALGQADGAGVIARRLVG